MSRVVIAQHDDTGAAIEAALEQVEVEELFRGRLVAIHPNDAYATPTESKATTQPDTLRAMIRYARGLSPRHLVVSGGSGSTFTTDEVFRNSGMMDVVEEEGVEYFDHNRGPFVMVPLSYGPASEVAVNPRVLEYETVVSLGQLKLHRESVIACGIKNIAMSWPAGDYYGIPRMWNRYGRSPMVEDKDGFIAGMLQRFPPHLSVVVGHPAMVATGPSKGKAVETGLVVAGIDSVAVDVVYAYLLGFDIMAVKYLHQAAKLGLGEGDLERIEIAGVPLESAARHLSLRAYGEELTLEP